MPIEGATYIKQLNPDWPTPQDFVKDGDDHIRLSKQVMVNTLPNLDAPVTSTPTQLNSVTQGIRWTDNSATAGALSYWSAFPGGDSESTLTTIELLSPTIAQLNSAPGLAMTWKLLQDVLYPVGAKYESFTDSRNPKDILGFGTWVAVVGLIAGVGSVTDTAGHTGSYSAGQQKGYWRIQNSQIVAQSLSLASGKTSQHAAVNVGYTGKEGNGNPDGATDSTTDGTRNYPRKTQNITIPAFDLTVSGSVTVGSGAATEGTAFFNPYYGCYIWRRTA